MSFRKPLTLRLFQGHFGALFEHETAIEFQKVDSILRFFLLLNASIRLKNESYDIPTNSFFGKVSYFRLLCVILR